MGKGRLTRGGYSNKLLRKLGQKWGEWENRRLLLKLPSAPPDLIDAWCNDHFAVQLFELDGLQWLSVSKHTEGTSPLTWAELQRIKSELVGPEREAVQVFPRESELVDQAEMYHLWLYPAGERCPFNFTRFGWTT